MDRLCWTSRQHWWEQVDNMLADPHLSEANGSYRARTWMAHLTDRDANHYAISPPSERWNSDSMLSTCPHQCRQLVQHCLSIVRVGHCVPLADFCLSLFGLHVLNRDVNIIQTNKQTYKQANKQTKSCDLLRIQTVPSSGGWLHLAFK